MTERTASAKHVGLIGFLLILISTAVGLLVTYRPILALLALAGLTLVFLVTVFLYHKLEYAVYVALLMAPFYFALKKVLPFSSGGSEELSMAGILQDGPPLLALLVWSWKILFERRGRLIYSSIYLPIGLLIAWAGMTVLYAPSLLTGLMGLRSLIRFIPFFLIMASFMRTRGEIMRTLQVLFGSMALGAAMGLTQLPKYIKSNPSWYDIYGLGTGRFFGIFGAGTSAVIYTNTLGIVLAIALLIGLTLLLNSRGLRRRFYYLLGMAPLSLILVFTFSRRGYITFLGGLLLMVLARGRKYFSLGVQIVLLVAFLVTVIGASSLGGFVIQRFSQNPLRDPSFRARVSDAQLILERSGNNPWFGYGIGSTGPVGVRFNVPDAVPAHNYYLMLLYEMGVPGLLFFIWLLSRIIRLSRQIYQRVPTVEFKSVVATIWAIMIMLVLNGLLGTTFEAYPIDLYFWVLVGLLEAISRSAAGKQHRSRSIPPASQVLGQAT